MFWRLLQLPGVSFTTAIRLQSNTIQSSRPRKLSYPRTGIPLTEPRRFGIPSIPPAETFPLILANGTIIQGIIFAAVLAQGFDSPFTRGCSIIAHFMWPGGKAMSYELGNKLTGTAIMLVPYIQFVFGIECTLRSIRRIPFQARGKYEVTMCCVTIVLMLIASWILSHVFREDNLCFASLVWFLSGYGKLELAILSIIGGFLMISAVTIFTRLSTVTMIDPQQRLAASRTVYYLILGTVSLVSRA